MRNPLTGRKAIRVLHKKSTAACNIKEMPVPEQVVISMQQHIGAPCEILVKPGAHVNVGEIIGDTDKPLSAPIHSSVSGTVKKITSVLLSDGRRAEAVVIDTDRLQTIDQNIKPPQIKSKEDFIAAVRASGAVGLGGAGFPTYIKLAPKKRVDTLLINAAECEPYITVDYRECIEHPDRIVRGIELVRKYLDIPNVILATENNKSDIAQIFADHGIEVKLLESLYPQGAEKLLIYRTLRRIVPIGALPADVGVIVLNVNTVSFIAEYLSTGMPLTAKNLTVDGEAINTPQNLRVPIGTSVKDIADFCGGYKLDPAKIILGGPMMGTAVCSDEVYVMKQQNAVLFFSDKEAHIDEQKPCIRCGRCVEACPMSLMPCELAKQHKTGDYEAMKSYSIMACLECGACAYSCPSGRALVQIFRLAKAEIRKKG